MYNQYQQGGLFAGQTQQPLFGGQQGQGQAQPGLFQGAQQQQPQGGLFQQQPMTQQGGQAGLFNQQPVQGGVFNQPAAPGGIFNQPAGQGGLFNQQQGPGQGIFNQPQQQQQLIGGGIQGQGLFQQQGALGMQNPGLQGQNQNQAINFQNYLQTGAITQKIKNIPEMIEDLKLKKNQLPKLYDQIQQDHQRQNLPQNFQQDLQQRLQHKTSELLESTKVLAIQQRDLVQRLEEYVTALGLVDKLATDGLNELKKVNSTYKEYQGADQILQSTYQRLEYQDKRLMYEQAQFVVPQDYQKAMVQRLQSETEKIGQAITKLEEFADNHAQMKPEINNLNFEEMIDAHLENKLQRLSNLSNLLFLLHQKIRYIQTRVDNIRTKSFEKYYPEKAKKLEFHSIDWAKDKLQEIIQKDLKVT